jgi:thiol-disulfide isomerase/thioredoxin
MSKYVLIFKKDDCPPCIKLSTYIKSISQKFPSITTKAIDIELEPEMYMKYMNFVSVTPTLLFVSNGNLIDKFEGNDPKEIIDRYQKLYFS